MRILAIDVGAGTQDILLYDSDKPIENCLKLVLPSWTTIIAGRIGAATRQRRPVFLTGNLMGGGPFVASLRRHIEAGLKAYATERAALSIRDNLGQVEDMGVKLMAEAPRGAVPIRLRDVDLEMLGKALRPFDVELPDTHAVAVQDHGFSPAMSNRLFRFQYWREFVERGGRLVQLVYREPPAHLTRMRAVQEDAPGAIVMDTGSAAIWGSFGDAQVAAQRQKGLVVVNIGNGHTLVALVQDDRIRGLFEHHTGMMTTEKLVDFVERLRLGTLTHRDIFDDGGHGCLLEPGFAAADDFRFVSVTGPHRRLAQGTGYYFAVPHGDMMLAGCFGLVDAVLNLMGLPLCPL